MENTPNDRSKYGLTMTALKSQRQTPPYYGKSWLDVKLPRKVEDWTKGHGKSIALNTGSQKELAHVLTSLNKENAWVFPKRRHFFFSDLHGDPCAFAASLVASGGVKKIGENPTDFELNARGKKANFIIGGDCFDKGPSSLGLLRTIHHLKKQGARVRILAGNHDLRVLFGMVSVGKHKQVENEYFFIRTGQKIIPLLKEVWDGYLKGQKGLKGIPSNKECKRILFPRENWFDKFPDAAAGQIPKAQIKRELERIEKKYNSFEEKCEKSGLSLRQVYATVLKWKELFLKPGSEFYWFYNHMRLAYRSGSFLFVHAGVDNEIAKKLSHDGVSGMNRSFKKVLKGNPFDYYYGPMCNTVRTKYRNVDQPFNSKGARYVRNAGISTLIHGHRNLHNGQRIALRSSILNFECDTSLDSDTRKKEGVRGRGASVTIIEPKGQILGVSSDYPCVKIFDPKITLKVLKKSLNERRTR